MRIVFWTSMPTHHQADFISAVRRAGVDLQVRYFAPVDPERIASGWKEFNELPDHEMFIEPTLDALDSVPDWRNCVHIISGYSTKLLRQLAVHFSRHGVEWVHLSEPAWRGLRWIASYPRKRWYAKLVNEHALGAFAYGRMAERDFQRWGIRGDKIATTFYTVGGADAEARPDPSCCQFKQDRLAFLYLGRLLPLKACDVLLNAFAQNAKHSDNSVLLLVGRDCHQGAYQAQAKRLGILDRVLFRGTVGVDEISNVLAAADVLLLPSRQDGWGVALNEGASAGLALIGSDGVGSAHHLIAPGWNGFRVRAGSVDSLATAMRGYQNRPALAQTHGRNSKKLFENFTPDVCADQFVESIRSWQAVAQSPLRQPSS